MPEGTNGNMMKDVLTDTVKNSKQQQHTKVTFFGVCACVHRTIDSILAFLASHLVALGLILEFLRIFSLGVAEIY